MSRFVLVVLKKFLIYLAIFSAVTPSFVGTYQKDCPEKLRKYKI